VEGALECADRLKLESVAFSGMGTGVEGLAPEEAAQAMISETKRHIERGTSLKKIIFVGFKNDLTQALSKEISESFTS